MKALGSTVRIIELDPTTALAGNDEVPVVDKSDLSGSVDGTDKKMTIQNFFETAPVRTSSNKAIVRTLADWIDGFKTSIDGLEERTQEATTLRFGITRLATDAEAKAKKSKERVVTPSNFDSMGSTEMFAGLLALATAQEVLEGQVDDKAITPKTLFESILGDATLSNNQWTFKLPVRNIVGDVKMELVIQVAQVDFVTMATEMNPQSNFNHIHETQTIEVTYPEQFQSNCLMVIPLGFEATPSEYTEGSDFWIRPYEVRRSGATLKATRINGTSDGTEEAAVRYLAIGF